MLRYLHCLTENQVKNLVTGKTVLSLLVAILTAQLGLAQTTYYVDAQNGSDANGNGTQSNPWQSFDKAYQNASNGDTIDLTGTFDWSSNNQPINASKYYDINKDLTIRGNGANQTIIQADNTKPNPWGNGSFSKGVFKINNNSSVTIKKLKIRHARDSSAISNHGTLILKQTSVGYNGSNGVSSNMANLKIFRSTIHHNFGENGGGIHVFNGGSMVIQNSTIAYNNTSSTGAGINVDGKVSLNITSSTIAYNNNENNAQGAGIYGSGSFNLKIKNSIVTNNKIFGSSLGTNDYDIYRFGGSITDNGGNVFGHVDDGTSIGFNVDGTSWYDVIYTGNDKTYDEKGSSKNGQLYLNKTLALNYSNNSTKTLAITDTNSVAYNEGISGSNGSINVPNTDQRGVSRSNGIDIGAFEIDTSNAAPSTIYVDAQNGDDINGKGTDTKPWETFDKAYRHASNGDTIDLTGTFDWSKSSQPTNQSDYYEINKNLTIRGQGANKTIVQANDAKPAPWGNGTHDGGVFKIDNDDTVSIKNLQARHANNKSTINNDGMLTLQQASLAYNGSTGIDNTDAELTVLKSTIHDNAGTGIVSSYGSALTVRNSTIAFNETSGNGAGIYIYNPSANINRTANLINNTIAYNDLPNGGSGAGIYIGGGNIHVKLKNNIVAKNETNGNSLGTSEFDIYNGGTVTDNGGNAFGHVDDGGSNGFNVDTNSWYDYNGANSSDGTYDAKGSNQSGLLNLSTTLALNYSNNSTKTLAITDTNSVAYNEGLSGSNGSVNVPNTDQRGVSRSNGIDIGAFEFDTSNTVPSTIYVDAQNGDDANGKGTRTNPWKTFDKAYRNASNGDTIDLTGTFDWSKSSQPTNQSDYYKINKNLTILGQGANQTIVQAADTKPTPWGSGTHDGGVFRIGSNDTVTVKNLKIRYANNYYAINNAGILTLQQVSLAYNGSTGIDNAGADLTVLKSTIHHNGGSGIYSAYGSALTVKNSTIAFNETSGNGAGIYIYNPSANINRTANLVNNTIAYNDLPNGRSGAGIYIGGGNIHVKLKNNIVAKNKTNGNSLGTSEYDIYNGGTVTDNGGNAFGHVDAGGSNGFNLNSTSWYDYNGSNNSDDSYDEKGSSQSGTLYLIADLASNNSNNGTQTLAFYDTNSIAYNQGLSGGNGNINVPSNDQRDVARANGIDIGAYEYDTLYPASDMPTYYVDAQSGSDTSGKGTRINPWKSFDKAYQNASNGDTIDLTGTFDWSGNSQPLNDSVFYKIDKNLTIRGQGAQQTIVQADNTKPAPWGSGNHTRGVFYIAYKNNVTIKNLKIRYANNYEPLKLGSAPAVPDPGKVNLHNVSVAYNGHRGIKTFMHMTIRKSTIHHNSFSGSSGGGLYIGGDVDMINTTIAFNEAQNYAAGIFFPQVTTSTTTTITNSTIAYNNCVNEVNFPGVGMYLKAPFATVKLKNSIVAKNEQEENPMDILGYDINIDHSYPSNFVDNGGNIFGHVLDIDMNSLPAIPIANGTWIEYTYDSNTLQGVKFYEHDDGNYELKSNNNYVNKNKSLNLASSLSLNNGNSGTKTLALKRGFPIDAGQPGTNGSIPVPDQDQRGKSRIGKPNIGAFEFQLAQPDNNQALDFDGSDDFVGGMDINPHINNQITVSAWVKPNNFSTSDFQGIVTEKYDPNRNDVVFELFYDGNKGKYGAGFYDGNWHDVFDTTNNTWTALNQWIFLAATYDGSELKIYKNGKLIGRTTDNTGLPSGDHKWRIGCRHDDFSDPDDFFNGKIDEVRIWSEARTQSEIRAYMFRSMKGDEANLEAYFPLNQSTGGNKASDFTKNQLNGTLNNMAPSSDWVTSNAYTTWQGDENGNWSNASNWTNGIPSSGDYAGIYNLSYTGYQKPIINSNDTLNRLVIGPAANIKVNADLTIESGLIKSGILFLENTLAMNGHTLTIGDNTEVLPNGGSSSKYVKGKVKKIGNEAFKFPIGAGSKYAPLKISSPVRTNDAFTASYNNSSYSNTSNMASQSNNPNGNPQLNNVSSVEHWDLSRTNGSSSVDISLYWKNGSPEGSNIDSLEQLKVAHWNGSTWENLGQDTTNGDTTSGSITVNNVSSFSPFTFGSTSSDGNALPVELLYFKAIAKEGHAQLNWATASETNNSHFIIQKRVNDEWKQIGKVQGHGTTTEELQYQFEDPDVDQGNTYYYRLKQVDFDGSYEYSDVQSLRFEDIRNKGSLLVYPNPVKQVLKYRLEAPVSQEVTLQIINAYGNQVYEAQKTISQGTSRQSISVKGLKAGQYILRLQARDQVYQKQFFKVE